MKKMHRAQILLDPDQHKVLGEKAQREGTSISEIVRQAVDQLLNAERTERIIRKRLQALDEIEQDKQAILDRRKGVPITADPSEILDQIRANRDDELLANAFDDHHD